MPLLPPGPVYLCDHTSPDIHENLALDEALLEQAEAEAIAPTLRFWQHPSLAVVLGASCRLRHDVLIPACQADSIPIARRSSGGGTVLIGPGALCVAVILPISAHPSLSSVPSAQRHVLQAAADALSPLVSPLQLLGHADLTLHNRKIAGSAQRRLRSHLLVHFTLLCTFPIDAIARYLSIPARQPAYRAGRSHAEFLANLNIPPQTISHHLLAYWTSEHTLIPIPPPQSRIDRILADKMHCAGWIDRF
ncbi:MAG: hypothetical protein KatS3mg108_3260 [Isosphaeraceae bacterium]|nr:MAG: hypothetical protein KatS3mg108_3260 [Isosphaeraceae bacterium]